ncbi:MAG: hypothetical protein V1662_03165 [Candidatus Omnitrophota bacterium]
MPELKNLDKLDSRIKTLLEPYLNKLMKIHQGNIVSIFLCGDATGVDFVHKFSPITLFVILEKLEFRDLQQSLSLVSQGIRKKIAAPLFLTRRHIQTSTDVFPMEFLEIKENHILLYGEDLWEALEINPANIRLFCEEQIKGKLIHIRQAYLEIGRKKKGVEALLKESLDALTPVLRNLLRLKSKVPPVLKEEIYRRAAAEFDFDPAVFLAILKDTKNDEKIGAQNVEVVFEKYLEQIQQLAVAVDQL